MLGIGDAGLQRSLVGQQEEPLAVVIKATRRVESRRTQVVRQRRPVVLRGEAREHAVGLVEQKQ